ncbi:MAG: hypothetical protein Unbinned96contig1001_4 [Prokaryotic dsDNA virus sp.]|nr:MAG: hypothetical protein Unbinned96contig1001_4 [Prokaryotic dsDNA virus sp.]|tara:strand:- start:848 stop:1171 length:324 start_codon:yes stop_codon:yes gene_type:complete
MINNLDGKSKKELIEIVQIQMDEYQKLQQANNEAQSLIGLLEAKLPALAEQLRQEHEVYRDKRGLDQQIKGAKDLKALLNGADWEDSELQMYLHHHIEDMKLKQASK